MDVVAKMQSDGEKREIIFKWAALTLASLVPIYFLVGSSSLIRYVIYLAPAVVLLAHFDRTLLIQKNVFFVGVLASALIISSVFYNGVTQFIFRDALIYFLIFLLIIPVYRVHASIPALLLLYGVIIGGSVYADRQLDITGFGIGFGQTRALLESTFGLISPLCVFFFYKNRNTRLFIFSILLSLLMFKRIAFFSMALMIAFDYFFIRNAIMSRLKIGWRNLLMPILIAIASIGIFIQQFFETLMMVSVSLFGGSIGSIEAFTSGRVVVYRNLSRSGLVELDNVQLLIGKGVGYISEVLNFNGRISVDGFALLHNDWLKIYWELGVLGVILTLASMYLAGRRSDLSAIFVIYTAILFCTDNVSIYMSYWISFILLLRAHPREVVKVKS